MKRTTIMKALSLLEGAIGFVILSNSLGWWDAFAICVVVASSMLWTASHDDGVKR